MIVGHKKQWQFLKESVRLGKISHAYLFLGQERIGKKRVALEFIKLLNCQSSDFLNRPCQKCNSCQEIQKSILTNEEHNPDLAIIKPETPDSNKEEIQISQIRDLNWRLSLKSFSAPFKTAIIDRAHSMNQEAQSCFLKTLEEPKGKAVLILISEYPETLLPTILSRVQKIKFFPVSKLDIENFLKERGVPEKEAKEIALFSFGRPGIASDFFQNPRNLKEKEEKIVELLKLANPNSSLASRFNYAKKSLLETQNLKETLEIWLRYFRNSLISRIKGERKMEKLDHYSIPQLESILKNIQRTISLISTTNINPKLALEILLMEL